MPPQSRQLICEHARIQRFPPVRADCTPPSYQAPRPGDLRIPPDLAQVLTGIIRLPFLRCWLIALMPRPVTRQAADQSRAQT